MESPDREPIGLRIARLRKTRGMSQSQLARVCGVFKHTVSKWERGQNKPYRNLATLSAALGVPSDYLLTGLDEILAGEVQRQKAEGGGPISELAVLARERAVSFNALRPRLRAGGKAIFRDNVERYLDSHGKALTSMADDLSALSLQVHAAGGYLESGTDRDLLRRVCESAGVKARSFRELSDSLDRTEKDIAEWLTVHSNGLEKFAERIKELTALLASADEARTLLPKSLTEEENKERYERWAAAEQAEGRGGSLTPANLEKLKRFPRKLSEPEKAAKNKKSPRRARQ